MTQPEHLSGVRALDIEGLSLDIGYNTIVEHGQGITVMIAEMHASCHNGIEGKKYHGLLIYDKGDFDTDVEEELLLSWIVTPTQQTADGGGYVVLLDYEDIMIVTMVDHTLGSRLIDVGRMMNGGDGVLEIIQRLLSIPPQMVEICAIFQTVSKSQMLVPIMIPLEIHDRLIRHGHNAEDDAKGQAREHMIMEMGWSDTRMPIT